MCASVTKQKIAAIYRMKGSKRASNNKVNFLQLQKRMKKKQGDRRVKHVKRLFDVKQWGMSYKELCQKRVPLITGTGHNSRLVKAAKAALEDIFKQFASNTDGTMSSSDLRKYILKCGSGKESATQERIQRLFNQYHPEGNGKCWNLKAFWKFYFVACVERERLDHVWNDLNVFGYGFDLRKKYGN